MDDQTIQQVAKLLGLQLRKGAAWHHVTCPFAPWTHKSGKDGNPSMGVEIKPGGISRWNCFSCGEGGDTLGVLFELQGRGVELPYAELMEIATAEEETVSFPTLDVQPSAPYVVPASWLEPFPKAHVVHTARDYLLKRGVPLDLMMKFDVRWDPLKQRVCFPIRDMSGVLRGLQGRDITGKSSAKYLHYPVGEHAPQGNLFWLGEQFIDFDKPIVTVEGAIDMTSVARVYPNVVAAMGAESILKGSAGKLDRLASGWSIVSMFDANMSGQQATAKLRGWCHKKRVFREAILPDDCDPGSLSPQQVREILSPLIDESLFSS